STIFSFAARRSCRSSDRSRATGSASSSRCSPPPRSSTSSSSTRTPSPPAIGSARDETDLARRQASDRARPAPHSPRRRVVRALLSRRAHADGAGARARVHRLRPLSPGAGAARSALVTSALLTLHPLGILIACVFAFSMAGLLWWMLHPPAPIEAAVAKALRGVSAVQRILVPVRGSAYNERAVELACRLGQEQKAEIIACHVIEVPLALPLSTPLQP